MFYKVFAVLALFMTLATQSWSAEFFVLPGTKTLLMMGETKGADVEVIEKYIADKGIDSLILKGPGGSLEAGYAIVDIIMGNEISITIPENTDCASACSLIFAAGSNRSMEAGSRLGFHLPFLALMSRDDAEKYCAQLRGLKNWVDVIGVVVDAHCLRLTYQKGLKDIKLLSKILVRDGISEKLIDLVIDTPIGDMTWLAVSSAKFYGLVNTD